MAIIEKISDALHRIALPIPFPVPPINVYYFDGGEPTLVDTGVHDEASWGELTGALRQLGRSVSDIRHVIVTHGHMDHFGQARRIIDASSARMHVHVEDIRITAGWQKWWPERQVAYAPIVRMWGVPAETARIFASLFDVIYPLALEVPLDRHVPHLGLREEVRLGDAAFQVIHCPGHTGGTICLYAPREKLLLSGDHLLEDITSNPDIYTPLYRGRQTGLIDYMESMAAIEGLDVERILPGHGAPYSGLRERIGAIRAHHEERTRRVHDCVAGQERTVHDIVQALWRKLKLDGLFLALKEVHGHLDLLEARGEVVRRVADGVAYFRAA